MSRAIRGSKYDLNMSLNYVRLAFQSAADDQVTARNIVTNIMAKNPDKRARIAALALALAALMGGTAQAKCHHYSIWKNPWPQSCRGAVAGAVNPAPQQTAPAPDRSWYVEVTDMPKLDQPPPPPPVEHKPTTLDIQIKNLPEDVQRQIGIEALRQIMNNLRLDP